MPDCPSNIPSYMSVLSTTPQDLQRVLDELGLGIGGADKDSFKQAGLILEQVWGGWVWGAGVGCAQASLQVWCCCRCLPGKGAGNVGGPCPGQGQETCCLHDHGQLYSLLKIVLCCRIVL